jgi:hypothetical protein
MLNYLHENPSPLSLCSGALCGHIKSGATEFTLYYLYAATKTDEKCIHKASSRNPAISMWRGTPGMNDGMVQAAADDPEILLFGAQAGSPSASASKLQDIFEGAGVHDPSSWSADSLAACVVGG